MALAAYQSLTAALLQSPSSPIPLVPSASLTIFINQSRLQVAGQGVCIRRYAALALVAGQNQYQFSSVTGLGTGVSGINNIRQALCTPPGTMGLEWMSPRPFEYFTYFYLNNDVPQPGQPTDWAQFGQGESGSIFVYPTPDQDYTLSLDVVGVPTALVDDTTVEAIPPLWTLPVPFYAAWFGFLTLQRAADAEAMLKRFEQQMVLARNAGNPDIAIESWSQSPHPTQNNQLGIQGGGGAAAG